MVTTKKEIIIREVKTDDYTPLDKIGVVSHPITRTLLDRYLFAANFCRGQTVLDAACGCGYGTAIMWSLGAKLLCGVDKNEKALEEALAKYGQCSDIDFVNVDVTKDFPPMFEDKFDRVVSIETFEHVKKEDVPQMLNNFRSACKNDGLIIITTPKRQTEKFVYDGGTHLYEYNKEEFENEIRSVFGDNFQTFYAMEFRLYEHEQFQYTKFADTDKLQLKCSVMIAVITNKKEETKNASMQKVPSVDEKENIR
jgi:cyclopropane fatty-acyl-phospholipid synthase-like methyltransferase